MAGVGTVVGGLVVGGLGGGGGLVGPGAVYNMKCVRPVRKILFSLLLRTYISYYHRGNNNIFTVPLVNWESLQFSTYASTNCVWVYKILLRIKI